MTDSASTKAKIKTRILILSDTHGVKPKPKSKPEDPYETESEVMREKDLRKATTGYRDPLPEADVVLHCGDLTKRSTVPEYHNTFEMLRAIRAPLKLVIAGNHDLDLDKDYWGFSSDDLRHQQHVEKVWEVINAAKADGVHYLTEGVHEFNLHNGALLRVYASPYTPIYGGWAFQYLGRHEFSIPSGVDVAMTHGPPLGVLDKARSGDNAGCPSLFEAVYRSRPKIHCFGHIHEGWGSWLVRWKDRGDRAARVMGNE